MNESGPEIDEAAAERKITTILVGVDGSPESSRAATFATRLAMQLGAEIVAAHVVVGSRGIGQAELLALGETSAKLAHQSSRPVLIVPPSRPADNTPLIEGSQ